MLVDVIRLENGLLVCDYCGAAVTAFQETCHCCGNELDYRDLDLQEKET